MSSALIIDDHPLFRMALRQAIETVGGISTIEEAKDFASALELLTNKSRFNLILLDLLLPDVAGYEALFTLRKEFPDHPVIVISSSEDISVIQRTMAHGALGFIPKNLSLPEIATAIMAVLAGDIWLPEGVEEKFRVVEEEERALIEKVSTLTPTQLRVLFAMMDGLLNKQIAYDFDITEATVKTHVSEILKKLGVNTRTQAVLLAQNLKIELPRISAK